MYIIYIRNQKLYNIFYLFTTHRDVWVIISCRHRRRRRRRRENYFTVMTIELFIGSKIKIIIQFVVVHVVVVVNNQEIIVPDNRKDSRAV